MPRRASILLTRIVSLQAGSQRGTIRIRLEVAPLAP